MSWFSFDLSSEKTRNTLTAVTMPFVLALLGVGMIYVGWSNDAGFIISIGGSFFGVGIATILNIFSKPALLDVLAQSTQADFKSKENDIKDFRLVWHSYHVTRKNNRFIWQYSKLDFTASPPGTLSCISVQTGLDGKQKRYRAIGGVRDTRLIIFFEGIDVREPTAVLICPFVGDNVRGQHYGVRFHLTWDAPDHAVSRAILSKHSLAGVEAEGDLDKNAAKKLNPMWGIGFIKQNKFRLRKGDESESETGSPLNSLDNSSFETGDTNYEEAI